MKDTYELMLKIKEELDKAGFETASPKFCNRKAFEYQGTATKDGKSWRTPDETCPSIARLNGFQITFTVVYRSNGMSGQSVDIIIHEWKDSSGKRIAAERVNVTHSEKQIQNRIQKIIDKYNAIEFTRKN